MVKFMTMIKVNVAEAKTRLSRLLKRLKPGEVIVVCRRNVPIAEIRAIPQLRKQARPIGLARGEFKIARSFFDPLPDDVVAGFEGREPR